MWKQQIPSPWRRRIGASVGHQARGVASWSLVLDARRGMHVVERISKYPPATMDSPQINMAIPTSFLASISPSSTILPPSFLALFFTLTDHFYLPLPAPNKTRANKDHASDNSKHPPTKPKPIETLWVGSCQIGVDQSFTAGKLWSTPIRQLPDRRVNFLCPLMLRSPFYCWRDGPRGISRPR